MSEKSEKFVLNQTKLIDAEQKYEIAETESVLKNGSQAELQRRGLAIYNVRVASLRTGFRGKSVVDIEPAPGGREVFPAHRIRVGDLVSVEEYTNATKSKGKKGETELGSSVSGIVSKITDTRMSVVVGDGEIRAMEKCRIAKLANNVTFERMKSALSTLQKQITSSGSSSSLTRVLLGEETPLFPANSKEDENVNFFDPMLNESQCDAVRFALRADTLGLVHGPPGTGKTFTLVEIIRQFAKRGKRILVCGPSNISVDNLVERLSKCKISIVRLGHPARMLPAVLDHALDIVTRTCDAGKIVEDIRKEMDQTLSNIQKSKNRQERRALYGEMKDLRRDYKQRERNVVDDIIRGSQVVLSTLNGVGSKLLNREEFDVVVIDEATQALEAECWIALLKGNKAILAGDHLQLPPTVKSSKDKKEKHGLEYTLFERMLSEHGDQVKRILTTQYRMNELIMRYPSDKLYGGKLTAHTSVKERLLSDLPKTVSTDETSVPLILIDTTGCGMYERAEGDSDGTSIIKVQGGSKASKGGGGMEDADQSKFNEGEADIVVKYVKLLVEAGILDDDIAVITPYNAQVSILKKELKERYPNMEIGSVDGFQGREKEAVILSLVRSNDAQEVGFLSERRRINVAITRPKRHLCVICDSETVGKDKFIGGLCDFIMENGEVRYADSLVEM